MVPFVRVVLTVLFATSVVCLTSDLGPSSESKEASEPVDPSKLAEVSPQHAVAFDPNEPRPSIQFSVEPDNEVDDEDDSEMSPDGGSADEDDSGHTDTSTIPGAGDSLTQSGSSGISRTTSGSKDNDADEGTVPMMSSKDQTDTISMDRVMSVQEFKNLVEKYSNGPKKLRELCSRKSICEQVEEKVDLDQTNGDSALNK